MTGAAREMAMSKRGLTGLMVWTVGTLCSSGCSNPLAPSKIAGDWSGRDVPGHFAYIEIRLAQQGSGMVGTACEFDGVSLGFAGVPVTVDHSTVTFTVYPGSANPQTFVGRFTSDGKQLKGSFTTRPPYTDIVLERGGNLCANAK